MPHDPDNPGGGVQGQNSGGGSNKGGGTSNGKSASGTNSRMEDFLPGVHGTDYVFYTYKGKTYVTYTAKLANGQKVSMGWRLSADDVKTFGVKNPKNMTKKQFQDMQVFGNVSEITQRGDDKHPFQSFLGDLQDLYKGASWLKDPEYVGVMLMGWAEGWGADELSQKLTTTSWYQSRTDTQREWTTLSKQEKDARKASMYTQMSESLDQLYGTRDWEKFVDPNQVTKWANDVAQGEFGNPQDGLATWFAQRRDEAEQVEGTQAWIDRETALEAKRSFMNRPEDMYYQLRDEADAWVGPRARPSDDVLRQWASDMVDETKSDGDWQKFMETQTAALYPFLQPGEKWQDRASTYKQIAEQTWGRPLTWDDPILGQITQYDDKGAPTGAALPLDQWEKTLRQNSQFWDTNQARDESFSVLSKLNGIMNGVQ